MRFFKQIIKHFNKPKHKMLSEEDEKILSKNDIISENQKFKNTNLTLKKLFGKKKKDLKKAKKVKAKGSF